MTSLGFVGLGVMSAGIARRLLAAGHSVHGYSRTRDKALALAGAGLVLEDSPRAAAEAADVVPTMVTNASALRALATGDDVLAGLGPGKIWVDMTMTAPAVSRELACLARDRGADMVDAPVSGSVSTLEEGRLSIMVGWSEETFREVVDRRVAVDVMLGSVIASPMLKYRSPFVLEQPDEAWFGVNMMQKDMLLALEAGPRAERPDADDLGRERAPHGRARDGSRASRLRRRLRGARRDGRPWEGSTLMVTDARPAAPIPRELALGMCERMRRTATAAARVARCTSPTTRTATSVRTRSSADRRGSRPEPPCRPRRAEPPR